MSDKMDDNGDHKPRAHAIRHRHEAGHAIACPFCKNTHAHEHMLVDVSDRRAFWRRLSSQDAYELLEHAPRVMGPLQASPAYEILFRRGLSVETRSVVDDNVETFKKLGWVSFDDEGSR